MDIYRELILEHYKHPHNFGHLKNPDATSTLFNSACGDKISMELQLDSTGKVSDIRFSGVGCAISQASASLLTDQVKGKAKKDIMEMTTKDITTLLQTDLTPSRIKCAVLPLEVLQKAVGSTV